MAENEITNPTSKFGLLDLDEIVLQSGTRDRHNYWNTQKHSGQRIGGRSSFETYFSGEQKNLVYGNSVRIVDFQLQDQKHVQKVNSQNKKTKDKIDVHIIDIIIISKTNKIIIIIIIIIITVRLLLNRE